MTKFPGMTAEQTALRARIAAGCRYHPDDPDFVLEDRQKLKALRLEDYIRAVVAEAPALSIDQRDRLAAILRGGG
jgi:hypothetical protein